MLGRNLKDVRTYFDLTQREMSEILGVSRSTYAGWENSIDNIPLTKLNDFSNYFDISLDYLCGLTNVKKYIIIKKEININIVASNLKTTEYNIMILKTELRTSLTRIAQIIQDMS